MNCERKLIVLFLALIALTLNSCETTPGIEEPEIFICGVESDGPNNVYLHCQHSYDPTIVKDVSIFDAIGYVAVEPKAFAKIKTHHSALHKKLNGKK